MRHAPSSHHNVGRHLKEVQVSGNRMVLEGVLQVRNSFGAERLSSRCVAGTEERWVLKETPSSLAVELRLWEAGVWLSLSRRKALWASWRAVGVWMTLDDGLHDVWAASVCAVLAEASVLLLKRFSRSVVGS